MREMQAGLSSMLTRIVLLTTEPGTAVTCSAAFTMEMTRHNPLNCARIVCRIGFSLQTDSLIIPRPEIPLQAKLPPEKKLVACFSIVAALAALRSTWVALRFISRSKSSRMYSVYVWPAGVCGCEVWGGGNPSTVLHSKGGIG